MHNPLLVTDALPAFDKIQTEHVMPALDTVLADNRQRLSQLLQQKNYTWDNLLRPLEDLSDRLDQLWSPVEHLHAVVNGPAWREVYEACLPKLTEYATELGQNASLYRAVLSIAESAAFIELDIAQQKVIRDLLRDFHLSGVALPETAQQRYAALQQQLAKATTTFADNLLDSTDAWSKLITDEALLSGLPPHARLAARETAEQKSLTGWRFTLEFPSYFPVIQYADDRKLREEFYTAYVTRASDQAPAHPEWDNTKIIDKILKLRHELAQLLGFDNFAEFSLATKMAKTPERVLDFLKTLAVRAKPLALAELKELREFVAQEGHVSELHAWDIPYYSEKLREHRCAISPEILRPYFPVNRVLQGLFEITKKLYGVQISERTDVATWHPDVRFFEIHNEKGALAGQFYLDLYARPQKRGGAWMDDCRGRRQLENGTIQTPIAFLTCNFSGPSAHQTALFTHDEVLTLFHEFGHGLQHLLTQINYLDVSGINGVPWDAVEFPSQFMENWCWDQSALNLISGHYQTGEPLPNDLFEKLLAAKNFQAGLHMLRQVEFSLFDFRLHREYDPEQGSRVQEVLDDVRDAVSVLKPPAFNRFQHGFCHIFSGGYAAGYYSYKWAEVLASDAFRQFEEKGIFDSATGRAFLNTILAQGGARDPLELFVAFRGREPEIDALLEHCGLSA
jgi:oligopeptidase A